MSIKGGYLKLLKIKEDYQKNGHWLLIGGSQHLKYGIHYRSGEITLGSQLKKEFQEKFINVCLWQIQEIREIECFMVKDKKIGSKLADLLEKNNFSAYDENGQIYFDAYLIHP